MAGEAGAPQTDREYQVWEHGRAQGLRDGLRNAYRNAYQRACAICDRDSEAGLDNQGVIDNMLAELAALAGVP